VVRRLADDYLAVLRGFSPAALRVTDKMPFNFGLLGVIRQVFPRAAIVHCRRHPIDTCLSIFNTDFEATIDFAADRDSLVFFYRPITLASTCLRSCGNLRFVSARHRRRLIPSPPTQRRMPLRADLSSSREGGSASHDAAPMRAGPMPLNLACQ
jgi:hypothetical protein